MFPALLSASRRSRIGHTWHAPALPDSCVTDHGVESRAEESLRSTSGYVNRHAPHGRWIDMPKPLNDEEGPREEI